MAARQGDQKDVEPGTMALVPAKKRKDRGCRKSAPELPMVWEEAEPEGDAPEPTGEDIAALGTLPEHSQMADRRMALPGRVLPSTERVPYF